jgi:1-deoxy-D-xylulose 5-phosphate reductoisomerase
MTELKKRHIAILGSTGSIGTQAVEVIKAHPDQFQVEVLTTNNNAELLIEQAYYKYCIVESLQKYGLITTMKNDD